VAATAVFVVVAGAGRYPVRQFAGKQRLYSVFRLAGIAGYRHIGGREFLLCAAAHAAGYHMGYAVLQDLGYGRAASAAVYGGIGHDFRTLDLAVFCLYYQKMAALPEVGAYFAFQTLVVVQCNSYFHFILLI
jgi:hypothetical protein